jgi:hypothetical protein
MTQMPTIGAIAQSRNPLPALPAPVEQHPSSELNGNFPMRRRNLR